MIVENTYEDMDTIREQRCDHYDVSVDRIWRIYNAYVIDSGNVQDKL